MTDHSLLPLIDPGSVPRFYVSGLARVSPMGPVALFSFHVLRPCTAMDPAARMIEVELIAPVDSVGPAFDLAITTLGVRTMATVAGYAVSSVVARAVRRIQ